MITETGIYDIDETEYHADPCSPMSASCSILQLIDTKSPLHAMWAHPKLHPSVEAKKASNLDFGSAFHMLMTGKGREIVPVNAPDWRTKEAKQQRDQIRENGGTPILMDDYALAGRMVEEVQTQLTDHEGSKGVVYEPEKTLVWKEGEFFFRIRPDWLAQDANLMLDLKATETSAAPNAFDRHIYRMGYDFRAAFYARGYQAVTGKPLKEYRFIACEVDAPHALSVFSLTPEALAFAGKRVDRAVDIWKTCLSRNEWPGYPNKIVYVSPPKWAENAQIEREILETSHGE